MSDSQNQPPPPPKTDRDGSTPENESKGTKRPRGLGGLLLIMALLMLLFFLINNSGSDREASVYDLQRSVLNGDLLSTTWKSDRVVAKIRDRELPSTTDGEPQSRRIEIKLTQAQRESLLPFVEQLMPLPYVRDTYRKDPARFRTDVQQGLLQVSRAYFVTDQPGPGSRDGTSESHVGTDGPKEYLVALAANGTGQALFHVAGDGRQLLQTRQLLSESNVEVIDKTLSREKRALVVESPNTAWLLFVTSIGPYLVVGLIIWFIILRQMRAPGGSGGVLSFGRSRAALYTKENRTNVTFDDVAGIEEAKGELCEIIEFLKNPSKFARLGAHIPRGVLLVGSPGTGKTLLAKAIAGEAEVPFFSISGSDFVEMFVGVGASRVRDLFKQARENSPCLVFLDEIDAVGRKRGSGMGGGHDEREQTLNAILVEMDGFDSDQGIILIAATNRPDVLDPALLRPGRFDRQIVIDMPDVKGREAILRVHARRVRMRPGVDLKVVARATPGFSGADLAAVINEAAILAAMRGSDAVDSHDLEEARDRVRWGREKRSRAMEEEDKKVTAYHEAGHALVSIKVPELDPLHKVTIVSRGMALGATMSLPERDDYHMRRAKLIGMIAMCYGGRIAEEIVFGDVSAGAQNDIEKATQIARTMVCELGMSDAVGPLNYTASGGNQFLGREFALSSDISQETLNLIDKEVRRITDEQYQRARSIILEHRSELDQMADALLTYETISGEEVGVLMRGDDLGSFRATRERERREAEARAASSKQSAQEQNSEDGLPDIGLSGAEGLAH